MSVLALIGLVGAILLAACGTDSAVSAAESNKAIVSRLYAEVMGKGDMAVADAVLAEGYVDHRLPFPDLPPNRKGLKETVSRVRAAFPDIQPIIQDMVAGGDKVAVRVTAAGTHQNTFNGIPPTGKRMSWQEVHIFRIADGKIVEHWGEFDMLGIMVQLGVVQLPGNP
jgi:steroid delta-isomerase-like uncharacterized protein